METLKAEIAKKRKLLEDQKLLNNGKKYFKRGDLMAQEDEDYLKKYGHKPDESASPLKVNSGKKKSRNSKIVVRPTVWY